LRDEESLNFHLQHGEYTANDERHSDEHFHEALRHIDQQSENDPPTSGRSTAVNLLNYSLCSCGAMVNAFGFIIILGHSQSGFYILYFIEICS
jgi:hypothetical protein